MVARYAKSVFGGHQLCKEVIRGVPIGAGRRDHHQVLLLG
jgi:hypothetical protein